MTCIEIITIRTVKVKENDTLDVLFRFEKVIIIKLLLSVYRKSIIYDVERLSQGHVHRNV